MEGGAPAKVSAPGARNRAWSVGGLTLWQFAKNVAGDIRRNRSFGRASELAFDFLFALFPLILFMLTLFGLFASRSVELQQDLLTYFRNVLPPAAFGMLRDVTGELAAGAGEGKLTLGIVVALWFGSGGVSSAMSALNAAYRVSEERSWLRVRAVALALTLAMSILLLAAMFLVLASGRFMTWLGAEIGLEPYTVALWRSAQWPAAIAFVLVSYSLIYFFAPDLDEKSWRSVIPGAVFGASVWFASSAMFRIYLNFFNTYKSSYGSLGAVMILLAWLYLTGLSFLVGGTINAEIARAVAARGNGSARAAG